MKFKKLANSIRITAFGFQRALESLERLEKAQQKYLKTWWKVLQSELILKGRKK